MEEVNVKIGFLIEKLRKRANADAGSISERNNVKKHFIIY